MQLKDFNQPVKCEECGGKTLRLLATGVTGGSTAEPWEYQYTHNLKPKYVRDSKGQRHKFNPNTMRKGRKGSG
mgnify:FL=1